jgi:hypothetical protein
MKHLKFIDDINIDKIVTATCLYFGVNEESVFKKSRAIEIMKPRQIIQYLSRKHTKRSFAEIGQIGLRYKANKKISHCTTLWNYNKVEDLIKIDKSLAEDVEKIEKLFNKTVKKLSIKDVDDLTGLKLQTELTKEIIKRDEEIQDLKIKLGLNVTTENDEINKLLTHDKNIIDEFCETRLKPYLKMLENRVTKQDLIDFQHQTRTQFNF